MPTYELTTGGATYEITAPNEQAALDALQQMQGGGQPSAPEAPPVPQGGPGLWDSVLAGARQAGHSMLTGMAPPVADPRILNAAGTSQALYQDSLQQAQMTPVQGYPEARAAHPIGTAVGESLPYLGAAALGGGMASGAGLLPRMGVQALAGGSVGFAQPGDLEERAKRAAVDAAIGAGGEVAGAALRVLPIPGIGGLSIGEKTADTQKLIKRAETLGFTVQPSSHMQSPRFRQVVEGSLEATPGGAMVYDSIAAANQQRLAQITARAIGVGDSELVEGLTDKVIDEAFTRAGKEFDRLMSPTLKVPVSDDLLGAIIRIDEQRVAPLIAGPTDPVGRAMNNALDFLDKHIDKGMPANQVQAQVSRLGTVARSQMRSNPELGHALLEVQDALLNATRSAMPKESAKALTKVRGEYRNLMMLLDRNAVDPVSGEISFRNLANTLQRKDRHGWMRGKNETEFYDAVRFLARVQPPLQTSGTAERTALREMGTRLLGQGAAGAGAGGAAGFYGDDFGPVGGAVGGAAAALGGPWALARGMQNPAVRSYLGGTPGPIGQQVARAIGQTAARAPAQAGREPAPPNTAATILNGRVPSSLLDPIRELDWFEKWWSGNMRKDRTDVASIRSRLGLLSGSKPLNKTQKAAVKALQQHLKTLEQ